ncbi:hypothetical protein SUGI_1132670, partial [Cryptomeria japonica]
LLISWCSKVFLWDFHRRLHVIDIKYPQLFPESFDWDPKNQHFIVGSISLGTIHKVSDAGVVEDFIKDNDYAGRAAVLGITVDTRRNRFLALIHGLPGAGGEGQPGLNALAAYDLKSGKRFFFVELDHVGVEPGERVGANDVAVESIWKCICHKFGRLTLMMGQLTLWKSQSLCLLADGITVRRDGVLLVASCHTAWFVQSPDNWGVATVVDEVTMNSSMFATAIALREDNKAYVLNCHLLDYIKKISREDFSIQEIEFPKEAAGEKVWVIVLIVIGLLYVFFWRFQMGYVIKNMNKKRA